MQLATCPSDFSCYRFMYFLRVSLQKANVSQCASNNAFLRAALENYISQGPLANERK